MVQNTCRQPEVKSLIYESFETMYVDRRLQPELIAKLNIKWFPTTILVGRNNRVLDVIEGYIPPKTFRLRLLNSLAALQGKTQKR